MELFHILTLLVVYNQRVKDIFEKEFAENWIKNCIVYLFKYWLIYSLQFNVNLSQLNIHTS